MDGFEATSQIRAWESEQGLPRTPIIALTAHAYEDQVQRCTNAGMDDHVTKPYKLEELRAALERFVAVPAPHQ